MQFKQEILVDQMVSHIPIEGSRQPEALRDLLWDTKAAYGFVKRTTGGVANGIQLEYLLQKEVRRKMDLSNTTNCFTAGTADMEPLVFIYLICITYCKSTIADVRVPVRPYSTGTGGTSNSSV